MAHVKSLWRFPVKGFSGEKLSEAALEAGAYFPNDRLYAIENGESGFDGSDHLPKTAYLCLMKQAELALFKTKYSKGNLSLSYKDEHLTASLDHAPEKITAFINERVTGLNPLRILKSPDTMRFTDSRRGYVSLINMETVRALEKETGKQIDPLRFRANIIVEGLEPFAENNMKDWRIQIGSVLFRVLKRTERCGATTVNPETGARDIMIPAILNRTYGHFDCGVYLETLTDGTISQGETLRLHAPPQMDLPFA
jgi:uncharacterized protein